jgi:hypothetical protein
MTAPLLDEHLVGPADVPRCDALLSCGNHCCDPVPCEQVAVFAVTSTCTTPDCDCRVTTVWCALHVEPAMSDLPNAVRRPL